ncbi:type II secretion system F family protein [bacterium]|nr:type II secretion system F family protein [bacterium]
MNIILSLLLGISAAMTIYFLLTNRKNLLELRIKKITKKQRKYVRNISKNIAEIIGGYNKETKQNRENIAKNKLLLMQAGEDSNEDNVLIYEGRKIIILIISAILLGCIIKLIGFSMTNLAVALFIIIIIYKTPDFMLRRKISIRQKEFIKNLPDAIDLLSICIKAGLGLDSALNRVASEFSLTSKVVAKEFERLNRDVLSGLTKQEAYRNMAICNPNAEVKSFVALLIQTDKLGTSITQSLDAYCDSVRTRKRQRIEELAQKAAGKMTIPMVLFMLPAIFLIILYPALIKISTNMSF